MRLPALLAMPRARRALALLLLVGTSSVMAFGSACGHTPMSNETNPDSTTSTGSVAASVEGSGFSASGQSSVTSSHANASSFSIVATNASGARISLLISGISTAGTYSMGASGLAAGVYTSGTSMWQSSLSGGSGSITFTTLTTKRAIGTFTFTGAPVVGTNASGNKTVTAGTFDITFVGP